jgi:hypothetical protein
MNCHYSPWFFAKFGLRFAEYTIFNNEYLITDFVIIIDASFVLGLVITICQLLSMFSNSMPVGHERNVEEHISSKDGSAW